MVQCTKLEEEHKRKLSEITFVMKLFEYVEENKFSKVLQVVKLKKMEENKFL